ATTEIYTLSLHDALPIYEGAARVFAKIISVDEELDLWHGPVRIAGNGRDGDISAGRNGGVIEWAGDRDNGRVVKVRRDQGGGLQGYIALGSGRVHQPPSNDELLACRSGSIGDRVNSTRSISGVKQRTVRVAAGATVTEKRFEST